MERLEAERLGRWLPGRLMLMLLLSHFIPAPLTKSLASCPAQMWEEGARETYCSRRARGVEIRAGLGSHALGPKWGLALLGCSSWPCLVAPGVARARD